MPGAGDRGLRLLVDRGGPLITLRNSWFLVPALLHAGLIFFLSSRALAWEGPELPHLDKLAHAGTFGLLAFLVAWGLFRVYPEYSTRQVLGLTVLVGICYGALDEFHQYFVPQRTTDPLDLLADAVGTILVVAGWWLWRRRRGREPLTGG